MRVFPIVLMVSGCSVLEMKPLASDYDPRTLPRCEADGAFAVGDTLGAIAFGGLAVAIAVAGNGSDRAEGTALTAVIAAALAGSAVAGFRWSSECDEANRQWDQRQIEQDEHLHGRTTTRSRAPATGGDRPTPADEDKRPVTYGDIKLFCLPTDTDAGPCFTKQALCEAERARNPDKAPACEEREVAACFNARRTLDDSSANTCAINVKDCEARREKAAADPDFTKVQKRCGVYRVRPRSAPPAPGNGSALAKPDDE